MALPSRLETCAVPVKSHLPVHHVVGALESGDDGHTCDAFIPASSAGCCPPKNGWSVYFQSLMLSVDPWPPLFCLKFSNSDICSFRND